MTDSASERIIVIWYSKVRSGRGEIKFSVVYY
jgi:hypothetical protein